MPKTLLPKFYFKHLYGANPQEWGVIGFPKSQSPTKALTGYRPFDLVLLAITKSPDLYPELWQELQGKIFAVCTLVTMDARTETVANPEMVRKYPDIVQRWGQATPIKDLWRFRQPIAYDDLGEGELKRIVSKRRGHLINLDEHRGTESDVRTWFERAEKDPVAVYRSPRTDEFIAR